MNLQEVSKFLIPVLVAVLALAMADEGVHDPSLYQFLDFTRVEQSQKNEGHRPFRWLNKFRRKSQAPSRSHSESTTTKEQKGSQIPLNYVIEDVSTQYRPQPTYHQAAQHQRGSVKKPKDTSYIILPPPPAGQAKQINIPSHAAYLKQQKKPKMPLVAAYKQRQQANNPLHPPPSPPSSDYKQQVGEVDYNIQKPLPIPSSQQTPDSLRNVPLVLNDGSHSSEDSTPTHVGSRYSKWLNKMRRNKGHHNQPEKLENQPPKPHNKPSENLNDPSYYFQNPSPNNQLQPVSHQSVSGHVNANGYRQPQTVNSGPQLAPPRPANTRPAEPTYSSPSPAPFRPEAFPTVASNQGLQENSPDSGETADQTPPPNRKSFYSKFMKKLKGKKGQKHEETVAEEEPALTPLQTPYKPPVEPVVYRPSQPTNYPPQPTPSRPSNVKPSRPARPAPYSSSGTVPTALNPHAPAYQDAPAPTTYSPPQNLYNKYSPRPTYATTEKPVAYSPLPEEDSFFSPPNKPDFIPSPFHGQSEKGQGIHEDPEDGFFEFGIFPKNNGFFEQNFKG
ncbi:uncharacterized protein LOC130696760 [Daphnia carinata]|uniref:uncharacterized protein LOC130696760 n=1 Tax=Daphnia carinata TaxID=120202 RepID=UPI002580152B|nr:uncharacterized protein LOC130696760 [Daphnia carinata]XP_057375853.1 uncharacterized protein LOC130696760 [Daphnia carinata]